MLRYVKSGMMLMSIAYIVLGLMLLIMPETSLLWIWLRLWRGGAYHRHCLSDPVRPHPGTASPRPLCWWAASSRAGLGLFTLAKPQVVASFLPVVFGIFIVVDGCSRIGSAIDLAKRKGEKWWMLLLFSIVSIALGALLIWHPFGAAVSVVMLCGILLIVEGALNLGCILYAAMELRTLDRMANAAVNATLTALGDALDEAEAAGTDIVDVTRDGEPVVYDAESTDVSDEDSSKT